MTCMQHSGSLWPWYQLGQVHVTALLKTLHTKLLALTQNKLVGYPHATTRLPVPPAHIVSAM